MAYLDRTSTGSAYCILHGSFHTAMGMGTVLVLRMGWIAYEAILHLPGHKEGTSYKNLNVFCSLSHSHCQCENLDVNCSPVPS